MSKYEAIKNHLLNVKAPNHDACLRIMYANRYRFEKAPGSTHNHQAWEGGYIDHVLETMNIAVVIHEAMRTIWPERNLPELGDVILCLFLHDIEKPWKYVYVLGPDENPDLSTKASRLEFRKKLIQDYGFELTEEQWNGIEFAEGEIHKYSNHERNMSPLAAMVHMCDVWSARGWYNQPHPAMAVEKTSVLDAFRKLDKDQASGLSVEQIEHAQREGEKAGRAIQEQLVKARHRVENLPEWYKTAQSRANDAEIALGIIPEET